MLIGVGSVIRQAIVGDVDTRMLGLVIAIMVLVVSRQILTVLEHTASTRASLSPGSPRVRRSFADQEAFFRTVLDHAGHIATAVDADGIVIGHSERAQVPIFGEIIGRRFFDVVIPAYAAEYVPSAH